MVITESPATQSEYQLISEWLESRFYHCIGVTAFLEQTKVVDAQWHLLRLYDPNRPDVLLGVAVVLAKGTCFWLPEASCFAELLCPSMMNFQPRRIVTTSVGRDVLRSVVVPRVHMSREYDQWIMVCTGRFPQANGRMANLSDITRLVEYQHQYNEERSVEEVSDWNILIAQEKVAVYEVDSQIVSIVRFGIETDRLVSIGGTYTFPAYRRQGFAECVVAFVVDRIVSTGRIAHLIVDIDNQAAVALYHQMGFECVGESYVAYPAYV
ncbi:GNAT family N-acetyltransferase [Acinetobacter piscicola]|uniref:GNAT family N-acetyltransferase n=1 Tax=Acinetobacter piscicola TaxID=2006115 RepID=UPI000B7FE840|nr:GNAT family N-acetyltransferase [Acinetobacter piscicola]